ncbi:MAG: hypothetical protein GY953_37655, partial [bacterium]|nr:hypothetical protein [bacterium]
MRLLLLIVALILTPVAALAAERVQFSILFGVGDEEPATWNGSIRASGARVLSMEVWRPEPEDRIDGTSWQLSSRRVVLTRGAAARKRQQPVLENGVFVQAEMMDSAARFEVTTD